MSVPTALIYLRVSTDKQADTDARDPEGYSIPAQREACHRKAAALGAVVVEEYVDKGESAKTADRPALQRMLKRIKEERDITYIIVHKVDRLARSRVDDVSIGLALRAAGTNLVSCTENIDETPSGRLLHGIMASIAEYHSANLATEILKGTIQKAKGGGTPHTAPLGYLNVRKRHDGRDIATIELDPERGPLIRFAFYAYATGEYSLRRLWEEVTAMGLTARPGPKRPVRPLSLSKFGELLHKSYYMGVVTYRGVSYPGNHDPLVDPDTFEKVQQTLKAHDQSGERTRVNEHYLKGSLVCARCESRLSITNSKGRSNRYLYFFCLGRQRRNGCNLPYLPIDLVESAVADHYRCRVRFQPELLERVRKGLVADLAAMEKEGQTEIDRQTKVIAGIEKRRRVVAQKTEEGVIPDDVSRERQSALATELVRARGILSRLQVAVVDVEANLHAAIDLARDAASAYEQGTPALRRQWNQALFKMLKVDDSRVVDDELAAPFDVLFQPDVIKRYGRSRTGSAKRRPNEDLVAVLADDRKSETGAVLVGVGSSKTLLVGTTGFEPALRA